MQSNFILPINGSSACSRRVLNISRKWISLLDSRFLWTEQFYYSCINALNDKPILLIFDLVSKLMLDAH